MQAEKDRVELDYDGSRLTTVRYSRNERARGHLNFQYQDGKISSALWFHRDEDELPSSSTSYSYDGDRLTGISARLLDSGSINFVEWGYDASYVYDGDRLVSRRSQSPSGREDLCNVELGYGADGALTSIDGVLAGDGSCEHRLELTSASGRLERVDRADEDVSYLFFYDAEDRLSEITAGADLYRLTYQDGVIERIESNESTSTFEYADHEIEGAVMLPMGLPRDVDDFFDVAGRGYSSVEPLTNIADLTWVRGIIAN